jgi:hypothetical protein
LVDGDEIVVHDVTSRDGATLNLHTSNRLSGRKNYCLFFSAFKR